jgi:hypothetical protein
MQQNLSEKISETSQEEPSQYDKSKKQSASSYRRSISKTESSNFTGQTYKSTGVAQVKVRFQTQSIKLYLYDTNEETDERRVVRRLGDAFSKLEFEALKLDILTYADEFKLNFMIDAIILDDLRLKGPNPLNRYLTRSRSLFVDSL